jgi:hypothetical protein
MGHVSPVDTSTMIVPEHLALISVLHTEEIMLLFSSFTHANLVIHLV